MNIGQVLNAVYDEDVGWRPTSGAIKPVHIANGLVRALQGKYYDTSQLSRFVVWWKAGKVPDDHRTFDALVKGDPGGVFEAFTKSPQDFEKARRYALGILGADKALFPRADLSSVTLTCGQMASRDTNDRGLGDFAARLLEGADPSTSLASVVRESLDSSRPHDPVTALVWPLLDLEGKEAKKGERANRVNKVLKLKHNKDFISAVGAAATTLATHERAQGNRLRTLQRAAHFACVATHAHAQAVSAGGDLAKRPPALIAMSGHRRSDIALASERSLDLIYERFERWLGDRLSDRIALGKALNEDDETIECTSVDGRAVRRIFDRINSSKKAHPEPEKEEVDARMASFMAARREFGDSDPARVLGHALVACYTREVDSGGPRAFLQRIGRWVGLLYPHFQGRTRDKRVRPSVPVLDMLVRSCVPAGEALALDDFLDRLWQRFGLIVGGRRDQDWNDAEVLASRGLVIDTHALVQNTEDFIDELVIMGLARRYPDDVTFVGDGYGA